MKKRSKTISTVDGKTKLLTLLYNQDNSCVNTQLSVDLVYADFIYTDKDFSWVNAAYKILKEGGIFIGQTDWHSDAEFHIYMTKTMGAQVVNKIVWKNEWGNHPKDRMHQCYDNILVYSKTEKVKNGWTFRPELIQVQKATVGSKGLNPSGRDTKTATAWIDDIVLTTVAKERVKMKGKNIRWQKPLRLYDRIIAPFSPDRGVILDLFMGSGSLGKWCMQNNRHYVGYEIDEEVFQAACENIYPLDKKPKL